MSKHIMLMYNMGNSGGKWFQDICNIHEDVQVWQEVGHFLKLPYLNLDVQTQQNRVYDFFMEQYNKNPKSTIGLCKEFDNKILNFCEEKKGAVVQMFRHPIGVVNFKNGKKMEVCEKRKLFTKLDSEEKIFETHVDFYAYRYNMYISNAAKWPLVKLEDLKKSIREETPYFRDFLEKALKVKWEDRHTRKIHEIGGLSDDDSHYAIWRSWDTWKKEIFLRYFKDIMESCDYRWED